MPILFFANTRQQMMTDGMWIRRIQKKRDWNSPAINLETPNGEN